MALLKLKKSSVPGKVPLTTDLAYGELALNYADGKLFFKNSSDVIQSFSLGGGGGAGSGSSISNGTSNVSIDTGNGNVTVDVGGTANVVTITSTDLVVGTGTAGSITGANLISGTYIQGFIQPTAGTTTIPPIDLPTGTLTTASIAGALEYDGVAIYGTNNTVSGRGEIPLYYEYRYTTAGSALGPTIADYFPTTSSINLQAGSYYEIDCMAYFLKTTAGTATFTWTNSSAPSMLRSYYVGTVATGFTNTTVTGTPVTGMAVAQNVTTVNHAATGSLSSAVYHHFHFKVHVVTNLATNLRLRITQSAGTATPQAGSYYAVRKISTNAGNFA